MSSGRHLAVEILRTWYSDWFQLPEASSVVGFFFAVPNTWVLPVRASEGQGGWKVSVIRRFCRSEMFHILVKIRDSQRCRFAYKAPFLLQRGLAWRPPDIQPSVPPRTPPSSTDSTPKDTFLASFTFSVSFLLECISGLCVHSWVWLYLAPHHLPPASAPLSLAQRGCTRSVQTMPLISIIQTDSMTMWLAVNIAPSALQ